MDLDTHTLADSTIFSLRANDFKPSILMRLSHKTETGPMKKWLREFLPVFQIRDILVRIHTLDLRIRILLFSSVTSKMPTKNNFFPLFCFAFVGTFTSVFKDNKTLSSR
jgi:hypothetical protein